MIWGYKKGDDFVISVSPRQNENISILVCAGLERSWGPLLGAAINFRQSMRRSSHGDSDKGNADRFEVLISSSVVYNNAKQW